MSISFNKCFGGQKNRLIETLAHMAEKLEKYFSINKHLSRGLTAAPKYFNPYPHRDIFKTLLQTEQIQIRQLL